MTTSLSLLTIKKLELFDLLAILVEFHKFKQYKKTWAFSYSYNSTPY